MNKSMLSKGEGVKDGDYPKLRNYLNEGFFADTSAREAFTRGFLNIAAYARVIRPSVSRAVGRPISVSAIRMALKRMQKRHSFYVQPSPIIRDVTVLNGLTHSRYSDKHIARATEAWVEKQKGTVPLMLETEQGVDLFFSMDHLTAFSEALELHASMTMGEIELATISFRLENPEALNVILQTIFSLPLAFRYTFFDNDRVTLVVFDEQVPLVLQKLGTLSLKA